MTPSEATSVISRANDQAVWPWQAEPYRLWSLWNMLLRFYAASFVTAAGNLQHAATALGSMELIGSPTAEKVGWKQVDESLGELEKAVDELPLSGTLLSQIQRIRKQLAVEHMRNIDVGVALSREAFNCTIEELAQHYFLFIPRSRRDMLEQTQPPFGQSVADGFSDASKDIAAAGRCIALAEWTAAVFHLMRVLEHGLRPMATKFNVPFKVDSWHTVLKGIEDGINNLRNKQGLTEDDRKEITFYSEAASEFRHFKDAWRNHVSHSRAHYDERDALSVWNHVKAFMQHLTTSP